MEVSLNCSNALFSLLIIEGQQQKDFFSHYCLPLLTSLHFIIYLNFYEHSIL